MAVRIMITMKLVMTIAYGSDGNDVDDDDNDSSDDDGN